MNSEYAGERRKHVFFFFKLLRISCVRPSLRKIETTPPMAMRISVLNIAKFAYTDRNVHKFCQIINNNVVYNSISTLSNISITLDLFSLFLTSDLHGIISRYNVIYNKMSLRAI